MLPFIQNYFIVRTTIQFFKEKFYGWNNIDK